MSQSSDRADRDVIHEFLSVADLIEEPQLAQLYAHLVRDGEAAIRELMDALDLAQGTAYAYVNGWLMPASSKRPRTSNPDVRGARSP